MKLEPQGHVRPALQSHPRAARHVHRDRVKRGPLKTLRAKFTADRKGGVKVTLRAGRVRKRPVKVKVTAVSDGTRATVTLTLR